MRRGDLWWASLPEPKGSEPGYRRPVLVVQADEFNRSRIGTVLAAILTSNVALSQSPGNVLLSARDTGLGQPSVTNVSQLVTLDKAMLTEHIGALDRATMQEVEAGLRLVLGL